MLYAIEDWEGVAFKVSLYREIIKGQNENRMAYIRRIKHIWHTLIDEEQNGLTTSQLADLPIQLVKNQSYITPTTGIEVSLVIRPDTIEKREMIEDRKSVV